MNQPSASGIDLARVALKAARDAARTRGTDAAGGASATTRPARRRTLRTGGRDPIGLGAAFASLVTDRGWETPTAGGGVIDQWADIAPELAGKVAPVHYDPRTGRLDLQPATTAYATQLRLLGRQLVARINGKVGRTVVRDLRVLPPRALAATGSAQSAGHRQVPVRPEAPARTRDDVASPGFHEALAGIRRAAAMTNPTVAAAIARQDAAILRGREPEELFAEVVAVRDHQDQTAARAAAAASSQAIAERLARADKAARSTGTPPTTLSGAA
ncbi:DciA family protein [Streptomyces sp. TLI_171]|uniref:DciA family protein n=1 Tax=Streptomyces sp. TLI_171 TaxID=1938859 RepID=UPI000C186C8F|nr:DciA family protein [Streptomyces sp. TLI_171]RKE02955.1 putative nucleic acid-binding Zn ribbon protein [Streptomyces sp. TLI_171]